MFPLFYDLILPQTKSNLAGITRKVRIIHIFPNHFLCLIKQATYNCQNQNCNTKSDNICQTTTTVSAGRVLTVSGRFTHHKIKIFLLFLIHFSPHLSRSIIMVIKICFCIFYSVKIIFVVVIKVFRIIIIIHIIFIRAMV